MHAERFSIATSIPDGIDTDTSVWDAVIVDSASNHLWVGTNGSELLVYDANTQPIGARNTFLWSETDREMSAYVTVVARTALKTVYEPALVAKATEAYLAWHAAHAADWLVRQQKEEDTRWRNESPREWGPRVTRCWSCGSGLDASVDTKCDTCHWIKCSCSACGCNRER